MSQSTPENLSQGCLFLDNLHDDLAVIQTHELVALPQCGCSSICSLAILLAVCITTAAVVYQADTIPLCLCRPGPALYKGWILQTQINVDFPYITYIMLYQLSDQSVAMSRLFYNDPCSGSNI